jgi:hypothetical protein
VYARVKLPLVELQPEAELQEKIQTCPHAENLEFTHLLVEKSVFKVTADPKKSPMK